MTPAEIEVLLDKVSTYEQLFHEINTYASITLDSSAVSEIIGLICDWSYAHRVGNGTLSDAEQAAVIQKAYNRLKAGRAIQDCVYGSK